MNLIRRKISTVLLICFVLSNSLGLEHFVIKVNAQEEVVLYFIDKTSEQWIGNDSAVIELVDNSNNHNKYIMTKENETMWSAKVPKSAVNITFNRMDSTESVQWNSWSAGGRDNFTTYYAEGHEYGHWEIGTEEKCFHTGDVVYLDLSEFCDWKQHNSLMYLNFSDATKSENNGEDINFLTANTDIYAPKLLEEHENEYLYSYTITEQEEGANTLRFWRGNEDTLWNSSIALTAEKYQSGMNCIKVTDWNESGYLTRKEETEEVQIQVDMEKFEYNDAIALWQCNQAINGLEGTLEPVEQVYKLEYRVEDVMENLIQQGEIDISEHWNISDFGMVTGYNKINIIATDKFNNIYQETFEIFNTEDDNGKNIHIDTTDNDGDGINNYNESLFETDKDNSDTDGDGLSDLYELVLSGTDPLKNDSDGNGVSDGEEDGDGDTLSNYYELEKELNPLNKDTDEDGLSDGEEINTYNTNPLVEDTDKDGLSDKDEIVLGFNPNKKDTNENGVSDCDEKVEQTLVYEIKDTEENAIKETKVSLSCSGIIENEVKIRNIYKEDVFFSGLQGLIGVPVEITAEQKFEKAEIMFQYDPEALGETSEEDLAVVWFDEENNKFVIYENETVVDTENHTVSYATSHFSKYGVIDVKKYYNSMCEEIDYNDIILEEGQNYDIVYLLDVSKSMTYYSRFERAKDVLYTIANTTSDEDWENYLQYAYSLSYNDDELIKGKRNYIMRISKYLTAGNDTPYLTSFGWSKDHNVDNALGKALEWLEASKSGNSQIVVIICDGTVKYNYKIDDVYYEVRRAKKNNIKIYAVNVDTQESQILREIAEETGGKYFSANTEEEIQELGKVFARASATDMLDTDGDGLYDIYEKNGFKLLTGEIVCTDPYKADTDDDGVSDYDELGGMPQNKEIEIGTKLMPVFTNWKYKSNPLIKDTDGDGVDDLHDATPLEAPSSLEDYVVTNRELLGTVNVVTNFEKKGDDKREKEYGTGKYSEEEIKRIREKYTEISIIGTIASIAVDLGADTLKHYLDNTGTDYIFSDSDMKEFVHVDGQGSKSYQEELEKIKEYALNVLKDGESITVIRNEAFTSHINEIAGLHLVVNANWFLALGEAGGYVIADMKRIGNKYIIDIRYMIFDYYDWNATDNNELIPGITNATMWEMTSLGIAKPYFVYGETIQTETFIESGE